MNAFEEVSHVELVERLRFRRDAMCSEAADRLDYLLAQEDLLEQAQQKAARLEAQIAEVQRPLDAEMGRLNRNLIEARQAANAMEALLLWALYHHQGGNSAVGQPIRRMLGYGPHEHLRPEHVERAKAEAARQGA
jgi:hypothetical protein